MPRFVDRVVIHARAGNGGNGCASVHREKFKPLGGPDGGNGGRGGSIVLVVDPQVHTLLDFHFHPHVVAPSGKQGAGSNRDGAAGGDLEVKVPDGTVVLDEKRPAAGRPGRRGHPIRGRRGRPGRARATPRWPRAPARRPASRCSARRARPATSRWNSRPSPTSAWSGFPSAGKSSLVSVISAAKPKIADYPFTTLVPNLGVVSAGEHTFTVADVPGLIPGASEGRGLGLDFLRHIERCAVLVHVVDCATLEPGRDPISDIDALEAELAAYTPTLQGDTTLGDLAERPRAVVLNKIDVPDARELADFVRDEVDRRYGWPVFEVSTVSREGLRPLTFALWDMVARVSGRAARGRAAASGDPADTRRRERLHRRIRRRGRLRRARCPARAVDRPDRLHQRRGRRLSRRPAGPPRRRGRVAASWAPRPAARSPSAT